MYIYRPQTKFAKVMFLHLSVILFTGGGTFPGHMTGGVHPGGSASGGGGRCWADPPGILRDTGNERPVRILLECILVKNNFGQIIFSNLDN